MSQKLMESTCRASIAGSGALTGAALGAGLGTIACPGIGTSIGYLIGVGVGGAWKYKAHPKMV
ncbi:hypothetical protein BK140_03800 [Paenibacillus macerans]|nr:hypothetical protein BK140_03800 [Paenibacillus macerans]